MKYILKKDLPFAKAGTEIEEGVDGGIPIAIFNSKAFGVTIEKRLIPQLISEGWIEEVKPREWVLETDCNDKIVRLIEIGTINRNEIQNQKFTTNVIKVREVIE